MIFARYKGNRPKIIALPSALEVLIAHPKPHTFAERSHPISTSKLQTQMQELLFDMQKAEHVL